MFCAECGASLAFEGFSNDNALIEVHISALDDLAEFPLNEHTHHAGRIAWMEMDDGLTKFDGSLSSA